LPSDYVPYPSGADRSEVVAERHLGQASGWDNANAVRLVDEHGAKVAFRTLTGDWHA
jgi:hypothetical protein